MKEIWKKVEYSENYEVSNFGRVRCKSHKKRGESVRNKEFFYMTKDKILKQSKKKNGYNQIGLPIKGRIRSILVHRLVATAFIPNPLSKPQINHKDGNGFNNKVSNLEWCTPSENGIHSYRILGNEAWQKGKRGESTPTARPVLQKTPEGMLVKRWGCGLDAVREGGFESSCISRCARGKSKTHKGFIWSYE